MAKVTFEFEDNGDLVLFKTETDSPVGEDTTFEELTGAQKMAYLAGIYIEDHLFKGHEVPEPLELDLDNGDA